MATAGDEEDDAHFLSLIAEAESRAIRSSSSLKRPLSAPNPLPPPKLPATEGPYLAALRGSNSALWAKDLTRGAPDAPSAHVPDRSCPCGAGTCLVLTSNTARNPGRRFYRCPQKEELGGCKFFEWCDAQPAATGYVAVDGGVGPGRGEVKCPCGAGWCLVLTAKSGRNEGQSYYRCPAEQREKSCGFFKWCNPDNIVDAQNNTPSSASSQVSSGKSGACFKCGCEGHWSTECPKLQSNNSTSAVSSASSTTCFKCGKGGHWARDCSAEYTKLQSNNSSSAMTCFKCGKGGHWARDCSAEYTKLQSNNSSSATTCFKCGKGGHWARDCSAQAPNTQFSK